MDIILHLGAHRSAATSFQAYLHAAYLPLAGQGIGVWGPQRTRAGLFHGLPEHPSNSKAGARAAGRVRLGCATVARRGQKMLVVSDQNMIGAPGSNAPAGALYPDIGERMARFHHAFSGASGACLRRVVLQIRSLDLFWASVLALALRRGAPLLNPAQLDALVQGPRSWRHVLHDLACAMPQVEIVVTPFERFAARPDRLLHVTTDIAPPPATPGYYWCNRAPDAASLRAILADRAEDAASLTNTDGRWMPFTTAQAAQLRGVYADDLHWFRAGAEGLARYIEEPDTDKTRLTWPPGLLKRGQDDHDIQETGVAQKR